MNDLLGLLSCLVRVEHRPWDDTLSRLLTTSSADFVKTHAFVSLAHFSVKEYLLREEEKLGEAKAYHINIQHAELSMAQTCAAYVLHFVRFTRTAEFVETGEGDFTLLWYTMRYWFEH